MSGLVLNAIRQTESPPQSDRPRPRASLRGPHSDNRHFDEHAIADLSSDQISNMGSSELAEIVRSIRGPMLRDEIRQRLETYDREALERMVHQSQRCCQARLSMRNVHSGR